jgi:hypothetical protein
MKRLADFGSTRGLLGVLIIGGLSLFAGGAAGPAGCATMPRGGTCSSAFPGGMSGTVPTTVCLAYALWSKDWDQNRRNEVSRANAVAIEQRLQQLAQANPNGPQFQLTEGQACYLPANGVVISVVVDGNIHWEEIGIAAGTTGQVWARVYPSGLGYSHLFNFTTHSYEYAENPTDMPNLYNEIADKYYELASRGWTCGGR